MRAEMNIMKIKGEYIMRQIVLSNHIEEVLQQRNKERDIRNAVKSENYNNELKKRQDRIDESKRLLIEAWKGWKFWQAIKNAFAYLDCRTIARPRKPFPEGPDEIDRRYFSGREGERKVDEYLQTRLNDEWVLLCGYRNFKGEIDRILVGPGGIFSIEIKNINGHVSCKGDSWARDICDRYGNRVKLNVSIVDGKGDGRKRGVSQQLNEPSDILESYLKRTLPDCRICRIVVLTHERARIGKLDDLKVDEVIVLSGWNIEITFGKSLRRLTTPEVERIVQKIESNHHYMDRMMSSLSEGDKEAA
jgi:hypothetical protein